MTRSVLPWSWSMLEAYKTCPRQLYETRIAKNFIEDPNKDYLLWGNAVHEAMEHRVRDGVPLPANMQQWEYIATQVDRLPGDKYCELELAVTADLRPTGYWDDDCWNRGKEDLVIVHGEKALDWDYKTGKPGKTTQQLELSAARVMAKFPEVNTVYTAFSWLQNKTWTRATYTRDMLGGIWDGFIGQIQDLLWSEKTNTWPARPSGLCKKSKKPGSTYGGCIVATCPHSEFFRK